MSPEIFVLNPKSLLTKLINCLFRNGSAIFLNTFWLPLIDLLQGSHHHRNKCKIAMLANFIAKRPRLIVCLVVDQACEIFTSLAVYPIFFNGNTAIKMFSIPGKA